MATAVRILPIITPTIKMSAPPPGDPMDISTPTTSSAPNSATRSPGADRNGLAPSSASSNRSTTPTPKIEHPPNLVPMPAPAAAAPAVHQPKIVQTAFIHKLYNMLEDKNIQHLISWVNSQDGFVMSPTADFSKVLAQYFKHTNISSFVRQLNMYGFHKVNDVFPPNGPDQTLWEFKHGAGNFKRGDIMGLREIKRRASRHALVNKDYNQQRPTPPQPGTPAESMTMQEGADARLANMESALFDMSMRLQRSEETSHFMHIKQQAAMDTLGRVLQLNHELAKSILSLVPNPENPTHRDVVALQASIQRQADMIRSLDEPHDHPPPSSRQYFSHLDNAPVSPRQHPQDDPRRSTLAVPSHSHRQPNYYKPTVPSNLSLTTRRPYGSIGGGATTHSSPSSLRPQPPPPPPTQHPLANVELPPGSLARRHTSADIRGPGWPPAAGSSPFASGPPSTQWPSSPNRGSQEDQRIRDSLSQYSLHHAASQPHSRADTPPPPPFSNGGSGLDSLTNWSWNSASSGGRGGGLMVKDSSAPPTRRGSMAHILNPTDTAESPNEDEEDPRGDEDRKRKRLQ